MSFASQLQLLAVCAFCGIAYFVAPQRQQSYLPDDELQRVLHSYSPPPKPAHCRPEFPGCVPRVIENIFFLHVPKCAGVATHAFLRANSAASAQPSGFRERRCTESSMRMLDYSCFATRAWHRNATEMQARCTAQRDAMASPAAADWYGALGCNFVAGHYDMSVYHRLAPAVQARTLVVVNAREPVALRVSLFHYLPEIAKISPTAKLVMESRNWTLGEFAEGWGLGVDTVDGATKMLAGDYCCHNGGPRLQSRADQLRAALDALHANVGAVLIQERMAESLEYLSFLLGWIIPNVHFQANTNAYAPAEDPKALRALARSAHADAHLYAQQVTRLEEQMAAFRVDPRPALVNDQL